MREAGAISEAWGLRAEGEGATRMLPRIEHAQLHVLFSGSGR